MPGDIVMPELCRFYNIIIKIFTCNWTIFRSYLHLSFFINTTIDCI